MAITIDQLFAELGYKIDITPLEELKKGTDEAEKKTFDLRKAVNQAGKGILAMGAAATAAIVGLAAMTVSVAEEADAVAKMSKQLNVSSTDLQRLGGAAKLTGGDITTLQRGMRTFTTGLADAKTKGTGPAIEGLEAIGLTVSDLEGLLNEGKLEDALGVISDAFNETGASAEKNAALAKLFGKAGQELRPLVEEGSEGIKSLGDEIDGVLTPEQLAKFEDMNDDLFLLERTSFGLKAAIAEALAPEIGNIAVGFREWINENDQLIKQDIPDLIKALAAVARDIIPVIVEFTSDFAFLVREFQAGNEEGTALATTIELIGAAWEGVTAPIRIATDLIGKQVEFILNAAEALGIFDDAVAEIKAGLGLDDAGGAPRGAPGFGVGTDGGQAVEASEQARAAVQGGRVQGAISAGRGAQNAAQITAQVNQQIAATAAAGTIAANQAAALVMASQRGNRVLAEGIRSIQQADARAERRRLSTKLDAGEKLSRAERQQAREFGLAKAPAAGGGGKAKPQSLLQSIGIDDEGLQAATAPAGGGASPLAGASFVRIDASLNLGGFKITVNGDASTAAGVAESLDEAIERAPIWRRIRDHYHQALPGVG